MHTRSQISIWCQHLNWTWRVTVVKLPAVEEPFPSNFQSSCWSPVKDQNCLKTAVSTHLTLLFVQLASVSSAVVAVAWHVCARVSTRRSDWSGVANCTLQSIDSWFSGLFLICMLCHHSDPMCSCIGSFFPHFQCEWSQRAEMVYYASFAGSFATLNSSFYRGTHPKLSGVTQLLCAEERRLQTFCLVDTLLCLRCIRSQIIGVYSKCHVTWRVLYGFLIDVGDRNNPFLSESSSALCKGKASSGSRSVGICNPSVIGQSGQRCLMNSKNVVIEMAVLLQFCPLSRVCVQWECPPFFVMIRLLQFTNIAVALTAKHFESIHVPHGQVVGWTALSALWMQSHATETPGAWESVLIKYRFSDCSLFSMWNVWTLFVGTHSMVVLFDQMNGMLLCFICESYQWLANRGFIYGAWAWVSKCAKIGWM